MDGDGLVEVALGRAHLDGDAEALEHLVAADAHHVQPDHLRRQRELASRRTITRHQHQFDTSFFVISSSFGYQSSAKHHRHQERFSVYNTFSMKIVFNCADNLVCQFILDQG